MSGTTVLVETLKSALKGHGIHYRDIALRLGLSEASVKRLFSNCSFTLDRVEQICAMMDMSLSELARRAEIPTPLMQQLSEEQERELVSERKLLLVAVLLVTGFTIDEILEHYDLTKAEAIKRLTTLDRLKLIELLPNNRVKLLIGANFAWRKNGPIETFFASNVQREFLQSRFKGPNADLLFLYGSLSDQSNAILQRRMKQLAKEFNELNADDLRRPTTERRGSSMILAIRPWDYFAEQRLPEPAVPSQSQDKH